MEKPPYGEFVTDTFAKVILVVCSVDGIIILLKPYIPLLIEAIRTGIGR